ncbi:hypothetical protein P9477_17745 [Enterobacter mori]|uniref:hypothetical protein n=1 Tax=Enterobacter mori TaxID=539813 RepID=UPI00398B6673|nr:hypothetical protein [Escherichia coli]
MSKKAKEKKPGELMLEMVLHIKNCVYAVKACHTGEVCNESDLPTFEALLDEALSDALKLAEKMAQ